MFTIALSLAPFMCAWRVCDVTSHEWGAAGDGLSKDTVSIRSALASCDEVLLPAGRTFLSGPLNLTSNQVLQVNGKLLASTDKADYNIIAPIMGYGWGDDENCFGPGAAPHKIVVGSLRYTPVIGAYHAKNVTLTGSGVIDGQGAIWWENCTKCHYTPGNESSFCEVASRPKLVETQFVDGLRIVGSHPALTLQNSPFWTVTPSYTQNIHIANLRILAPMDRIGNTDGVNLDSCRNAVVENIFIKNSDDGVCIKSGLNGFGLNLGIPTENVLVRNITCPRGGRGGFAVGSEMSGGVRNVTYRDSVLRGQRGIHIKPSVGRGGYIQDLRFLNIEAVDCSLGMGRDGQTLMPDNKYVPLISNVIFANVSAKCRLSGCAQANRSMCFNLTVEDQAPTRPLPLPRFYACKTTAKTMFGQVKLPWGVCLPMDAPVNLRPNYPNYGVARGNFSSLAECRAACD